MMARLTATENRALMTALVVGVALLILRPAGGQERPSADRSITAADLRRDVEYLASDEMRGRLVGTTENRRAARYIEDRFRQHGLRAVAAPGSYRQSFNLTTATIGNGNSLQIRDDQSVVSPVELTRDFFPMPFSGTGRAEGPVVFVGFGISASSLMHQDYEHLDVSGKIVLVLDHEPGEFDPDSPFAGVVASEHGRAIRKALEAQRRGAVGIAFVEDIQNHAPRSSLNDLARRVWPEIPRRVPQYQLADWVDQVRIPAIRVSTELAERLLKTNGITLRARAAQAEYGGQAARVDLPHVVLEMVTSVQRETTSIDNVVGLIEGADPDLRHEWVIVCAHYDHEGATGTRIFNGADDDASGVAGLLEIAEAYSLAGQERHRPERSILLAAWNAEEQGLLGAWAYTEQPLAPLSRTVAVVNMDMIGRSEEVPAGGGYRFAGLAPQTAESNRNAVNIIGHSFSRDLRSATEGANEHTGLDLRFRYDNNRSNLLRRSDHWPFLFHRVPAIFVHTGLHPDYHTERDLPDTLDYDKMARIVTLVYELSRSLAGRGSRPEFD